MWTWPLSSSVWPETIERAKATDPKELRTRIASLEAEIAKLRKVAPVAAILERVEVSVLTDADRQLIQENAASVGERIQGVAGNLRLIADDMTHAADAYANAASQILQRVVHTGKQAAAYAHHTRELSSRLSQPVKRPRAFIGPMTERAAETEAGLKQGERRMLAVLAERHPLVLTKSQLALLAGRFSMKGGTFGAYFGNLRRLGYLDIQGKEIGLTQEGLAAAWLVGGSEPLGANGNSLEAWMQRLKGGEREMLQLLVDLYPRGLDREQMGSRLNKAYTGGTFGSYLGTLKRNHLVKQDVAGLLVANMELLGGRK